MGAGAMGASVMALATAASDVFRQLRPYTGTRNFAEKSTPGVSATTASSQYRAGGSARRVP